VVSCKEFVETIVADAEHIITTQLQTLVVVKAEARL
jgi:hypothetical protein